MFVFHVFHVLPQDVKDAKDEPAVLLMDYEFQEGLLDSTCTPLDWGLESITRFLNGGLLDEDGKSAWRYVLKFIITGDAAVGKSSLLVLTDQRFLANRDPTAASSSTTSPPAAPSTTPAPGS
ncbi:hypothetical protein B0H19DRAFT_1270397 [Mycena capillaripes]|nr:hypothetical protein B0H19DRAFT_1270397 [Mycena capillaripes]